jgi:subtilisin
MATGPTQAQQLAVGIAQSNLKIDFDSVETVEAISAKVSPHLLEVLRVKEVAQAMVLLNPSAGLAAAESFEQQAVEIEQHLVFDNRGWSASIADAAGLSPVSASLSVSSHAKPRGKKTAPRPKAMRFSALGVVLGDVHSQGVAALRQDPRVRYVGSSLGFSLIAPTRVGAATRLLDTTWGVAAMEVNRLWAQKIDGTGVRVGHIDTGVDASHPALRSAVQGFLLTDYSGFPVPNAPKADTGTHGTHTAGTIAGRPVAGKSIGVAPGAELYCAAVIEGGNVVARILAGLDWAVKNNVRIVSLSLGLPGYHDDFHELMAALRARGVLPVVAVGNEGPGTSRSPGNYDIVLSVGACDKDRRVAYFSSSETFAQPVARQVPDLVGPGVDVISAKVGGGFVSMDGSSMATPHIAGLAALLWQAKPTATVDQIEQAIFQSCTPSPDGQVRGGRGFPNAPRAYTILTGQQVPAVAVAPGSGRTRTARKKASKGRPVRSNRAAPRKKRPAKKK